MNQCVQTNNGSIRGFGENGVIRLAVDYAFEMPSVKVSDAQRAYGPTCASMGDKRDEAD